MTSELTRQRNHYRNFIKDNPEGNHKTVGWGSEETQDKCAESVYEMIGAFSEPNVLDVGCGYGAHFGNGIDIIPEMIDIARKIFPDGNYKVADIMSYKPDNKYDYYVAIGTFNLNDDDYFYKAADKMLGLAEHGIAINCLDTNSNERIPNLFYRSPEDIVKRYRGYKVMIDTSFLDHCFTFGILK